MKENGKVWAGMGYSEPVSVSIIHWCENIEGQPSRMLERIGRDLPSAIEAWNRRAAPTPPTGKTEAEIKAEAHVIDEDVFNG